MPIIARQGTGSHVQGHQHAPLLKRPCVVFGSCTDSLFRAQRAPKLTNSLRLGEPGPLPASVLCPVRLTDDVYHVRDAMAAIGHGLDEDSRPPSPRPANMVVTRWMIPSFSTFARTRTSSLACWERRKPLSPVEPWRRTRSLGSPSGRNVPQPRRSAGNRRVRPGSRAALVPGRTAPLPRR